MPFSSEVRFQQPRLELSFLAQRHGGLGCVFYSLLSFLAGFHASSFELEAQGLRLDQFKA